MRQRSRSSDFERESRPQNPQYTCRMTLSVYRITLKTLLYCPKKSINNQLKSINM